MKTAEFRCEKCDRLLAKFTDTWEFGDSAMNDRTYLVAGCPGGHRHYLEIKCPRCKYLNKKEVFDNERAIGKRVPSDTITNLPTLQIGEQMTSTEALEAHNRVSRHGDNLRRSE